MSSYLNNMDRTFLKFDQTFRNRGVHSTLDQTSGRVIYAFLSGSNKYLLTYNTTTGSFENFSSIAPTAFISFNNLLYLCTSRVGLNMSPDVVNLSGYVSKQQGWLYGAGQMGKIFDNYYNSVIAFIVNEAPIHSKLFNTLEYNLSVYNSNNTDDWDRNFDAIRVYNEYQDSGIVPLVYGQNCERLNRVWRVKIPRVALDDTSPVTPQPKMRSQTLIVELYFYNDSRNQRFQLESIQTKMTVR
jgi:hypothetical protein